MKNAIIRVMLYIVALLILAFGLTLNVKSGLGVSPIISVAQAVTIGTGIRTGDTAFVLYIVFVLIQIIIHLTMGNRGFSLRKALVSDILQLPLSLVFTRVMNVYYELIPDFTAAEGIYGSLGFRLFTLSAAIFATGVGAALSMSVRIVPNPGDGIVQTIGDRTRKDTGFVKNAVDGVNVLIAIIVSLFLSGRITSIGAGTIIAFLATGRVIALFNKLFLARINGLLSKPDASVA